MDTAKKWKDWIPGSLFGVPLYYTLHDEQYLLTYVHEYVMFRPKREASHYLWPTQVSDSGS